MSSHLPSIDDVILFPLDFHNEANSNLTVFTFGVVNFEVKRIFYVRSEGISKRGSHSHKLCNQILFCLGGSIKVKVFDGINHKYIELTPASYAMFIPAGIWAEQIYKPGSILLVAADQNFEEADYIRDLIEYLKRNN